MKISTIFTIMSISSLVVLSGCADFGSPGKKEKLMSETCDHAQPETFTIKITAGKDKSKPPSVDKETVEACFEDDIVFEGDVDDFTIDFKGKSPFEKNLKAEKGKAKGKVKADPKEKSVKFKYDVVVPGYPPLDPIIIIARR